MIIGSIPIAEMSREQLHEAIAELQQARAAAATVAITEKQKPKAAKQPKQPKVDPNAALYAELLGK